MDTKKYITFDISEVDKIDFNEVLETSEDSLRVSNNNLSFVKFRGSTPTSVQSLSTKSQEYNEDEIIDILSTDEWKINTPIYSGNTN
jgi:hypothetical protein